MIIHPKKVNMGGFIVEQSLPMEGVDMIDPFLLICHAIFNESNFNLTNINYGKSKNCCKTTGSGRS